MAQGEFTKQEIEETRKSVQEMWDALTKNKRMEFFGRLNDVFLFLSAAGKYAPDELGTQARCRLETARAHSPAQATGQKRTDEVQMDRRTGRPATRPAQAASQPDPGRSEPAKLAETPATARLVVLSEAKMMNMTPAAGGGRGMTERG